MVVWLELRLATKPTKKVIDLARDYNGYLDDAVQLIVSIWDEENKNKEGK